MSKVTVADGTNVRLAGRFNTDNVIAVAPGNKYEAVQQSRGDFFEEGGQTNTWWVKIKLDNQVEGWVHAVRIKEGGPDEPVPGVPEKDVHSRQVERWV